MKIICLIIARGGSKSLPGKNILKINNIPLIAYSIYQAKQIKKINRIIVSTDDNEIMRVSKKYGAEILFKRPKIISGDKTTDLSVFKHALDFLNKKEKYYPDLIVDLRAPEPIREINQLKKALEIMINNKQYSSLRSLNETKIRPEIMWQKNKNGFNKIIKNLSNYENKYKKKYYWQNGYIDIIRASTIIKNNSISGNNICPFLIKKKNFTIDYPDDLKEISLLLKRQAIKIKMI